jgi:hypothetical protein
MTDLYSSSKDKVDKIVSNYHSNGIITDEEKKNLSTLFITSDSNQSYYDVGNPQTSNEVSYALYDRESNYLNEPLLSKNTENVYIKTDNNLYLESKEDGQLNLTSFETLENKKNAIWSIINSDNSNFVRITNYQDTFLKVTPRGIVENPQIDNDDNSLDIEGIHNSWKLIKLDNEGKFFIESNKYKYKRIEASLPIKVTRGNTEAHKWIIEPIIIQDISINDDEINKLTVEKIDLIDKYSLIVNKNVETLIFLEILDILRRSFKQTKNKKNNIYKEIATILEGKQLINEVDNLKKINIVKSDIDTFTKKLDQYINEKNTLINNEIIKIGEQKTILNKDKNKYIKLSNDKRKLNSASNISEDSYYNLNNNYKSSLTKKRILFTIKMIIVLLLIIVCLMLLSMFVK